MFYEFIKSVEDVTGDGLSKSVLVIVLSLFLLVSLKSI